MYLPMLHVHVLSTKVACIMQSQSHLQHDCFLSQRVPNQSNTVGWMGVRGKINSRTFRCTFYLDLAKDVKVSVGFELPALLCLHLSINSKQKDLRLNRARKS